jgi:hypothetical protein
MSTAKDAVTSRYRMAITSTTCTTVIFIDRTNHYDECEPFGGHAVHERHDHIHGEGCGHVAVPHGDHVDYIHDGCRHAVHNDHYDEH